MPGLKLVGEVSLDGSGFERGLNKLGSSASSNLKHFVAGAFGIYGVEQAIKKTVETASDLVDQAQRMNETVESVQLLSQAAKDASTDVGTVASAFEKLNLARARALKGDKDALGAFGQLGVGQSDLQNKSAFQIASSGISDAVKNKGVAEITTSLSEVFGKSFGQLIPFLMTDFDDLHQSMAALGKIMDTKTALKLDALGDRFSLLANLISNSLAPVIVTAVQNIQSGISDFLGWLDKRLGVGNNPTETTSGGGFGGAYNKAQWATLGLAHGLLSIPDLALGALGFKGRQSAGDESVFKANEAFKNAGLDKGMMNDAADKLVEAAKKGSLKDRFDKAMAKIEKEIAIQAAKMAAPPDQSAYFASLQDQNAQKDAKPKREPHERGYMAQGDSLVAVGNFLGAGSGLISGTAEKHLQVAERALVIHQSALDIMTKTLAAVSKFTQGGDNDYPL